MCLLYSNLSTPRRICSAAACAIPGLACSTPAFAAPVHIPCASVCAFFSSLCYPWTCLFWSSLYCPRRCLTYNSLCGCWHVCLKEHVLYGYRNVSLYKSNGTVFCRVPVTKQSLQFCHCLSNGNDVPVPVPGAMFFALTITMYGN